MPDSSALRLHRRFVLTLVGTAVVLSTGSAVACAQSSPPTGTTSARTAAVTTTTTNPLAGRKFFADPNSKAVQAVSDDPADAAALNVIAKTSAATWFGDWNSTDTVAASVHDYVSQAAAAGAMPIIALYAIPMRDCGSYSGGGMPSAQAYRDWIDQVAAGLDTTKSVVIVEPDALAQASCLSSTKRTERIGLIKYAVDTLTKNTALTVYVDAGHANWPSASTIVSLLKQVDISRARGFSLNVSSFYTTSSQLSWGDSLSKQLNNTHYVVDTSRNGQGPAASSSLSWCNPAGRGLGKAPTTSTGDSRADAFLWIKRPGESDGACHTGDPAAGQWFNSYALGLVSRRVQ